MISANRVAILIVFDAIGAQSWAGPASKAALASQVTIYRDNYGMPHIAR
jgi:acyl-homoserine lactone acylase PvdQ